MDRFALFALAGLITLPWWRAVVMGVLREIWAAGEVREHDSSSPRSSGPPRLPPRGEGRRSATVEVKRTTRTLRELRAERRRWEGGFGRRGL